MTKKLGKRATIEQRLSSLQNKYDVYIKNVQWHIETNNPKDVELSKCRRQISCYMEIVQDIQSILNK